MELLNGKIAELSKKGVDASTEQKQLDKMKKDQEKEAAALAKEHQDIIQAIDDALEKLWGDWPHIYSTLQST